MESKNKNFEDFAADPKSPTLDEYYKKAKVSFRRIWKNRFLWFWGMFLPGSVGIGFNLDKQISKLKPENIEDWQTFLKNNLESFAFLFAISIIFWLLLWGISAIARSGVIQALFCLHNPKSRKKLDCKTVWKRGKKHFKKILLLDFFAALAILVVFLILLIPVSIMILVNNQAGGIFLFGTCLALFILFAIFVSYLLQSSIVYLVLVDLEIFSAVNLAFKLITKNFLEVIKLFAILFLIGLLQGAVFVLVIAALVPFWGVIWDVWFSLYQKSFVEWLLFSSAVVMLLTVLLLFVKAIFSLWIQDIWIWWVQTVGGGQIEAEKPESVVGKSLFKTDTIVSAEGITN